jgi:hypothetical protein
LSSCNNKQENFDIDLSNYKVPNKSSVKVSTIDELDSLTSKKEIVINELKNYQNKSEVLSAVKFGKKDPFSESDTELPKLNSNFQLKGLLKTNMNNYVFVNYLGNEGTITEESIGGLNTNLLPDGAKVLKIDPENMKLIIEFQEENYTFEL